MARDNACSEVLSTVPDTHSLINGSHYCNYNLPTKETAHGCHCSPWPPPRDGAVALRTQLSLLWSWLCTVLQETQRATLTAVNSCTAQSRALWGAPGVPLYCAHTGGSRHLPGGGTNGNVKAQSPSRQSPTPSQSSLACLRRDHASN